MSVTLRFPKKGRILFAAEELEGGRRYLRTRRWFEDGTFRDEYQEMPEHEGHFLYVPGLGDIDDIALRDIVQKVIASPSPERQHKPDIAAMYREFLENRALELSGRRVYPRGWPKEAT